MHIFITGMTGYIASHMVALLNEKGHTVSGIDNFSNSNAESLERLSTLCGKDLTFEKADVCNQRALKSALTNSLHINGPIDAVMHFAGLKAVGESSQIPLHYHQNNISGTLNVLACMKELDIKNFVFSSSATVYGVPESIPLNESCRTQSTNPYGHSKLVVEELLSDISSADPDLSIARLRYFNPVGAHPTGLIGEMPNGIPNNLMPYVFKVAAGDLPSVNVFGNDYDTKDGTGVRDYIHVCDLVSGHLAAVEHFKKNTGLFTFNLGTGQGYSVLEMIKRTEEITGVKIPYNICDRRQGDVGEVYADASLAKTVLGWEANYGLDDMIKHQWKWVNTLK
jgi:UDP-glucose 4-epimerase